MFDDECMFRVQKSKFKEDAKRLRKYFGMIWAKKLASNTKILACRTLIHIKFTYSAHLVSHHHKEQEFML